ncbi:hypothetical protein EPR50_G00096470 [Perca flavescens]|uniref:Uncharacterized protein n=1 Tax=Perca flavescens TaxID=8167 RepID=A0A484CZK3_PERFV|nr:hypothetical protein EPR50_G00096470 [Perca flavescens]
MGGLVRLRASSARVSPQPSFKTEHSCCEAQRRVLHVSPQTVSCLLLSDIPAGISEEENGALRQQQEPASEKDGTRQTETAIQNNRITSPVTPCTSDTQLRAGRALLQLRMMNGLVR